MAYSRAINPKSLSTKPTISLLNSITKTLQTLQLKPYLNPTNQIPSQNIPQLSQFTPHLNPSFVIDVIKSQSNPYHALYFFNWASNPNPNPNNYAHINPCYDAMFDVLLDHHLFTSATQFMKINNMVNDANYAKIIRVFGDCGMVRGAIDMFYEAKNLFSDGRCRNSCNAVLRVLVKANKIDLARGLFDQVVKDGVVRIDIVSYTTMIRGYCKVGMIEDARKVFDEMPYEPNRVTYSTLVSGYSRKGMMVNARQIVDLMIMKGGDCGPDLVTYTALIDGYCKKGEMEEAMRCFDEMVKQDCEPNLFTYNAIIFGFCLVGKIDEARKLMTRMRLNGIKDDVVTHTSLLKGFCVAGRLEEALQHLKDMVGLGMKPDIVAYGLLVNECCRLGKADEAILLLKEMIEIGIRPSITVFNVVFDVLLGSERLDDAVVLLKGMPSMRVTRPVIPNFKSYFNVIASLCKAEGRVQQVEEFVHAMIRDGHKPDASLYSCLIKMYCKHGDSKMATQVFHDSMNAGYIISLDCFVSFIDLLCAQGKTLEAEQHCQDMSKKCQVAHLREHKRVLDEFLSKFSDKTSETEKDCLAVC